MALATTCPQCKTSFKVVPDQLKLRRGLVRCGVCQHVFSGVEHLRYVDKDESTEKLTPGAPPASAASQAGHPAGSQGAAPQAVSQPQPHPAPAQPHSYPASQPVSVPESATAAPHPAEPADPETGAFGAEAAEPAASSVSAVADPGPSTDTAEAAPAGEETATSPKDTASFGDESLSAAHQPDDNAVSRDAPSAEAVETAEKAAASEPETAPEAPAAATTAAGTQTPRESGSGSRSSRSRRRRARQERKQQQPVTRPPVAHDDDDLKTVFFMADAEDDTDPGERQLPESLRAGARKADETSDPLDPDAVATGKLIDEANKIWRQQQPRTQSDSAAESPSTDRPHAASDGSTERESARSSRRSGRSKGSKGLLHWLTPMRRRIIAGFLALLALIQLLAVFRTEIAYHLPFLRPLASLASTLTGQTIQPPMSLSTLSIESFELRATQEAGKTRLTAILRNRSAVAARWPAMELTLTGPSNALLVRKVLLPNQYLPAKQDATRGIAANAEVPLDLVLDTGDLNLAGYSVALFYP